MQIFSCRKGEYHISTDKSELNIPLIHHFLANESYWAKDIPLEIVKKSIQNSLCFGIYRGTEQIGFARLITDFATFAYLADVFILQPFRGKGLSKWLVEQIMGHPDLQGLRRWMLATSTAHGLYQQFGWKKISDPTIWMEIRKENPYSVDL
jgi:GNAT superfamily N-acetyltransferase